MNFARISSQKDQNVILASPSWWHSAIEWDNCPKTLVQGFTADIQITDRQIVEKFTLITYWPPPDNPPQVLGALHRLMIGLG
jgi:hypothetical protein